jgi:ribosomal protein S18 acetylase RimI-like enzyme
VDEIPVKVGLRAACDADFAFAHKVYLETMRWIIERLFGWDEVREDKNFAQFFKLDEVRIITVDEQDVGWIQEQIEDTTINLGSFYVAPWMQRQGVGTQVLQILLAHATNQSKAITLAVVKINPAVHFYEKHGFRITREDEYKYYMRADPR